MNRQFFSFLVMLLPFAGFAQVGVGTNNVHPSAKFQIESNNKGFLQPRIALTATTDVVTIANPATGLMVYNTATAGSGTTAITPGVHYFDGAKWVRMDATQTTSLGGGNGSVIVTGKFNPNNTFNRTYQNSLITAMNMGEITLPPGKWEVQLATLCEITSYNIVPTSCNVKMQYWLQKNNTVHTLTADGIVFDGNPMNYKFPPLDGGDSLFNGSAAILQPVNPANPYHNGSFYIHNTSSENRTYYLFASENILCSASWTSNTGNMPAYSPYFGRHPFYQQLASFNRLFAVKME